MIGSNVNHPLLRPVEAVIISKIGEKKMWRAGTTLDMSCFSTINNKSFVHNHLLELGFVLDNTVTGYCYTGMHRKIPTIVVPMAAFKPKRPKRKIRAKVTYHAGSRRGKGKCNDWVALEVIKVPPFVRGVFRHLILFNEIDSQHYNTRDKRYISRAVTELKGKGYDIESIKQDIKGGGKQSTIYKLKTPIRAN